MSELQTKLLSALEALAAALNASAAPSMIIGGIAVIANGVPRLTADIDATIWAEQIDLDTLVSLLAEHDITPRVDDAIAFARENQVLLLTHRSSGTPLDVSLAWLPFEAEALSRARAVSFRGVRVSVASPDDLIVYKALAWRERDRTDIERLLVAHFDRIDLDRVRTRVREFAEAIDDPDRLEQLERLIQRVARLAR